MKKLFVLFIFCAWNGLFSAAAAAADADNPYLYTDAIAKLAQDAAAAKVLLPQDATIDNLIFEEANKYLFTEDQMLTNLIDFFDSDPYVTIFIQTIISPQDSGMELTTEQRAQIRQFYETYITQKTLEFHHSQFTTPAIDLDLSLIDPSLPINPELLDPTLIQEPEATMQPTDVRVQATRSRRRTTRQTSAHAARAASADARRGIAEVKGTNSKESIQELIKRKKDEINSTKTGLTWTKNNPTPKDPKTLDKHIKSIELREKKLANLKKELADLEAQLRNDIA